MHPDGLEYPSMTTGSMRIGAQQIPANADFAYWDGLIDEVCIYDRALDAEDVQRLYMSCRGGGVQCNHAEPVISHCVITGNEAQYGAGIADCDGIIENCLITQTTRSNIHTRQANAYVTPSSRTRYARPTDSPPMCRRGFFVD